MHRVDRAADRQEAARLRRAVVGAQPRHPRPAAETRIPLRPQHVPQRLHAVLRTCRRPLDQDRLLQASGDLDEAARARHRHRPDRDARELVSRRPAADDVHQEGAEQPRLRQSEASRGNLARPVRLGVPRDGVRGVPDHDPSGCRGQAAGAAHAGASLPAHERTTGRALHAAGRGRRGLRATDAAQESSATNVRAMRHF